MAVPELLVKVDETRAAALLAALRRLGKDLDALTPVHRKIARIIAARVRQLAPVRTGKLKSAIRASGKAEYAAVTFNRERAYWAHIVARGHPLPQGGNVPATDFDIKALEQTRPKWQGEYTQTIDDLIRKHGLEGRI